MTFDHRSQHSPYHVIIEQSFGFKISIPGSPLLISLVFLPVLHKIIECSGLLGSMKTGILSLHYIIFIQHWFFRPHISPFLSVSSGKSVAIRGVSFSIIQFYIISITRNTAIFL